MEYLVVDATRKEHEKKVFIWKFS